MLRVNINFLRYLVSIVGKNGSFIKLFQLHLINSVFYMTKSNQMIIFYIGCGIVNSFYEFAVDPLK